MTDQSTTASTEAAGLPVVAQVYPYGATVRLEWASVHAAHNAKPGPLCSVAAAQAAITRVDQLNAVQFREAVQPLRDQVARLERERDQWRDEYRFMQSQALKAAPLDVEAVMRLADAMAAWDSERHESFGKRHYDAAREALRCELTKGAK